MIDLRQEELAKWHNQNFGPDTAKSEWQTLGMAEEVGELCHALLKRKQRIREGADSDLKAEIADAFGDMVVFGIQVMTCEGIDAEKAIDDTIKTALARRWRGND